MDDPAAVGRRLRAARERAGLSQRALAFPGCTPAYVSRIEVGTRIPSLQLLDELGSRLGVSGAYLARGAEGKRAAASWLAEAEIALGLDEIEEARELYEGALAREGDVRARSQALEGLGEIALREADPEGAVRALEEALRLDGRELVARPALAERLARAYASRGQAAAVIAILERCVAAYEAADDPVLYLRFASLLGYALADDRAELGRAEQLVAKAIAAARETTDPYTRARIYRSQSRLLAEAGQAEAAEQYARQTLQLLRSTEDTCAVAHSLQTLAHICLALGRPHQALSLLQQSEPLVNAAGSPTEVARHCIELGRALAAVGESEAANASSSTRSDGELASGPRHPRPAWPRPAHTVRPLPA